MPGPLNDTRAQTDRAVKDAELKIMDFIGTSMIYRTPSYRNKALPSLPSLCTTRYSFLRAPRRNEYLVVQRPAARGPGGRRRRGARAPHGPGRHLPFAPGLRRVFFTDGLAEFLPLVFRS